MDELEKRLSEDTIWAVRSSGVAEDLEGASFAGQYDTILGVRTSGEVARALRDLLGGGI